MKVVIPAAGYAMRLYPLTENTPKPLLDVGSKKIIERILEKVEEIQEIDHIFIVTNDRFYNSFLAWEKGYQSLKPITILNNGTRSIDEQLGAIGDMHYVIKNMNIYDDTLIIAGDNLFEFSLLDMYKHFKDISTSTIAVRDFYNKELLANTYGVVEVNDNHKIIGFEEKPERPKTSLTATMVYMFKKEDLQKLHNIIEEGAPDDAGEFIKYLSNESDVHSFIFKESWYDIGSYEQLEEVKKRYG